MPSHDIVVIGASAGGVEALIAIVSCFPTSLPAAVFVVIHLPVNSPSVLPQILQRAGPLPSAFARHGEAIRQGHIYVAPPDHHLLIKRGYMHVMRGPKENRHRPSADVLFRTAAGAYGARVVGVVLTGALDDGTMGLQAVKRRGGLAVVQAPHDALVPSMPQSALEAVKVDYCLPLAEIAPLLVRLASGPVEKPLESTEGNMAEPEHEELPEIASGFTCPDCHGALWELRDGELIQFRCRVEHTFSPDSLLEGQSEALERALWSAMRGMEERAALTRHLGQRMRKRGILSTAARFDERAKEMEQQAMLLRQFVLNNDFDNTLPEDPKQS
jgi:two-component system, chemotaxis family, protein-glutamate methylesterase/glutaminase